MINSGLAAGNQQNEVQVSAPRSHSKFDLSKHIFGTYRFGELAPTYVMECVPKDKNPLRSRHNIRSYTMKAPLMQDVSMFKDSFAVPMRAILPLNWEKLYTNPVIGDDVVAGNVGTTVEDFIHIVINASIAELGQFLLCQFPLILRL